MRSGKEKLRAFLCYIDHYSLNFRFWNWLDERGIAHMESILSRNFRDFNPYAGDLQPMCYAIDTATMGTMIDSIAQMNARSPMVRTIRGKGLMIAVELEQPCGELVAEALQAGILINVTQDNIVRLLPALTMTDKEADELVSRVSALIQG